MKELDKAVYENLKKIDQSIADIYHGAIDVLKNDNNPERIHQSAHSVREMLNRLTGNINVEYSENQRKTNTLKKKLLLTFDPLGGPSSEFQEAYTKLKKKHDWFVKVGHHGIVLSLETYTEYLTEYESNLKVFFKPYFSVLDEIDRLLQTNSPNEEDLKRLKLLIRTYAASKYFFDNIDEKWLPVLRSHGIFKNPPAVIRDKNGIRFQIWPAAQYLSRIVHKHPKAVYEIIKECNIPTDKSNRNILVIEAFLELATRMPIEYMKNTINIIVKKGWIISNYYSLTYEYALAASKILLEHNLYEGIMIFNDLLLVKNIKLKKNKKIKIASYDDFSKNPFQKIDIEYLERLKNEILPIMIDKFPESTLSALVRILSEILEQDDLIGKFFSNLSMFSLFGDKRSYGSYSIPWVLEIDGYEDHHDNSRQLLTIMIRNSLTIVGEKSPQDLCKLMVFIRHRNFGVYRRLELYIYALFPQLFEDKIANSILKFMDNTETYHEHYVLLKQQFPYLDESTKRQYLKRINRIVEGRQTISLMTAADKSEEEITHSKRMHKLRLLEPIHQYLPDNERKWYDDMIDQGYNVAIKGHFISYKFERNHKEGIDIGLSSEMSPDQVINSITDYVNSNAYHGHDDITSEKFISLVHNNPFPYSERAMKFVEADLAYCYHLVSALNDSVRNDKAISWRHIVRLCSYLLKSKNKPFLGGFQFYFGSNPIASLLEVGMTKKSCGLDLVLRAKIWSIVKTMINLTLSTDKLSFLIKDKELRDDYLSTLLNNSLFNSVSLITTYGYWVNTRTFEKSNKYQMLPEVKEILDVILQPLNIKLEVIGALSYHLAHLISLNREWTEKYLHLIFPSVTDSKIWYYASWECYVRTNPIYATTSKLSIQVCIN